MSDSLKRAIDLASESGANAIRTWSTQCGKEVLDYCEARGLKVCMGLWIQHERHGFDYGDRKAVLDQLESLRAEVLALKDHPALLMWGVGNEVETESRDVRVWDAVNDVSRMIHELDGNHPTMYVVADYNASVARLIETRVPDVDLIGVNSYANLGNCLARWDSSRDRRPIIVTEWGPSGWWESAKTLWGAPIEPVSAIRLEQYRDGYSHIAARPGRVLGSFAFYWGPKQERTDTWFSLALSGGILTEASDALSYRWTGRWPANRAPHLVSITVNGSSPGQSLSLASGSVAEARVAVTDPEGDNLRTKWVLREETTATSVGGDAEAVPREVTVTVRRSGADFFVFLAPERKGAYRLFAQVEDGKGKAATANFPFYVD
jgi:hypothetical protein